MNEFMTEMKAKFDAIGTRFRPVRVEQEPQRPAPRPSDIEAGELESWATDKDTRVVYVARLDRLIDVEEAMKSAQIGNSRILRYHLGRLDALREERAWILKVAGLANGPR